LPTLLSLRLRNLLERIHTGAKAVHSRRYATWVLRTVQADIHHSSRNDLLCNRARLGQPSAHLECAADYTTDVRLSSLSPTPTFAISDDEWHTSCILFKVLS
jgi:hypothetical protein